MPKKAIEIHKPYTFKMLWTALILGLASSLHCIGMCGPIALMLPVNRSNPFIKVIQIFIYHFGRITAYASLGLLFGLVGKSFFIAGYQQQLSITIGVFIILMAIIPEKQLARYNFSKPIYKFITKVKSALGNQFKKKDNPSIFIIGLLNGYLPCGMVYMALFGAIAMNQIELSIFYMILFGIGTIPFMSFIVYIADFISISFRNKIQKIIPIIAIIIGLLFIIRGLGLNIPFISPHTNDLFIQSNANC